MYANEALSVAQWQGIQNISKNNFKNYIHNAIIQKSNITTILLSVACDPDPAIPCMETGTEVLASRSFQADHIQLDFLGLAVLYLIFHFAAYVSLIFRSRRL